MVKKYNPHIRHMEYCYDDFSSEATLIEERNGNWVKLETYNQVTSGHIKQIAKLQKQIAILKNKTNDTIVPSTLVICPCCNTVDITWEPSGVNRGYMICRGCSFVGPEVMANENNINLYDLAVVAWNKRVIRMNKKKISIE